MPTIYLAMADYGYEGERAMKAFGRKVSATRFVSRCKRYSDTRPSLRLGQTVTVGGRGHSAWMARLAAWRAAHPAGEYSNAETFEVTEVQFVP